MPSLKDYADIQKTVPISSEGSKNQRVFVVFGRDHRAQERVFKALRHMSLKPYSLSDIHKEVASYEVSVYELIKKAFDLCYASVVVFSPDDEARLREAFHNQEPQDSPEHNYSHQPRQNVLFEAGYAAGFNPKRTVGINVGTLRQMSDLAGLLKINTTNSGWALQLAMNLRNMGCSVVIDEKKLKQMHTLYPIGLEPDKPNRKADRSRTPIRPTTYLRLKTDPVQRRKKLYSILEKYGGPSRPDWRHHPDCLDNKVMVASEKEDKRNPLEEGEKVFIQMHSNPVPDYNGKIGIVLSEWRVKHHYWVTFPNNPDLPKKAFHVMYLSRFS